MSKFVSTILIGAISASAMVSVSAPAAVAGLEAYSPEKFVKAKASGKTVVLAFHTTWCPICLRQKRVLEKLATTKKDIIILSVDYDRDTSANKQFDVAIQSTLIIFKGGREVARKAGEHREAAITQLIKTV